jgi:hypothetical protein
MFFRLWIIVEETDTAGPFGLYHGKLLGDTLLNIVPGVQRLYANYQIGVLIADHENEYLDLWKNSDGGVVAGGGTGSTEGGTSSGSALPPLKIDLGGLPVSQAPTIVGAAYADFGVLGVVLQMVMVGALMGSLLRFGVDEPILLALLAGVTGHVAAGVNLGLDGEQTLILMGISLAAVIVVGWRRRAAGIGVEVGAT